MTTPLLVDADVTVDYLRGLPAATDLSEHAELATLNVKHYRMIKGLKPAYARR